MVEDLWRNKVRSVTWTGGGEPTLHPDFDQIIGHTAWLDLPQAIYTHGGHIDSRRAAASVSLTNDEEDSSRIATTPPCVRVFP